MIHARVVLRSDTAPTEETMKSIMAHARRRLGAAVAPHEIVAVDRLPVTRSGKVMRRLLHAASSVSRRATCSTLEGPAANEGEEGNDS